MKNKNLKKALSRLNSFENFSESEEMVLLTALEANVVKGGDQGFECGDFKCPGSFTCGSNFTVGGVAPLT